jgi:flagellar hook assembly protein FlgD
MKILLTCVFLCLNLIGYSQVNKANFFTYIYKVDDVELEAKSSIISSIVSPGEISSLNLFDSTLYFSASVKIKSDLVSEWTSFGINNLYKGDLVDNEFNENLQLKNVEIFSKKIKNGNNTGSVCFNATGDTAFFIHNELKKKEFYVEVVYPQIYVLVKKGNSWKGPEAMPFNNYGYSYTDPFYDSKTQRLYFSSDMPYGKGGYDIYYATLASGFTSVTNHSVVNSTGDDRYYFSNDNNVFISSNRKGTKGGFDVYWMDLNRTQELRNFEELNTVNDDFGLTLTKDFKNGMFLSRVEEKVKPFYFNFNKNPVKRNQISGTLKPLNSETILKDSLIVNLKNGKDSVAYSVFSGKSGHFVFNHIIEDANYKINYKSKEEVILIIEDEAGRPVKEYLVDENNNYTYSFTPSVKKGVLELMSENQVNETKGIGSIAGKLVYEDKIFQSIPNVEVKLVNTNGDVVNTVKTNEDGVFVFRKIPLNINYTLSVAGKSEQMLMLISDNFGVVNTVLKDNNKQQFLYGKDNNGRFKNIVVPDETILISGKFEYRNLDLIVDSLMVMLIGEDGEIAFTEMTNNDGYFEFDKALLKNNYTIKAISNEELNLTIFNEEGNVCSILQSDEKGFFNFRQLELQNVGTLTMIPEDQMDLTLETGFVVGQLFYMNNSEVYPSNVAISLIDSSGQVVHEQITDSKGNFEFRNLSLNSNYIFKTTVANDSIIMYFYDKSDNIISQLKSDSTGVFKYRKLNLNFSLGLNPIDFNSDESIDFESKVLFGTFKYRNLKLDFKDSLTVYIYDENGILISQELVNEDGSFRFRNLPLIDNFQFKLQFKGELMEENGFTLYVNDRQGKKIALLQSGDKGYFNYRPLGLNGIKGLKVIDEFSADFVIEDPKLVIIKVYFNTNKENVVDKNLDLLNRVKDEMLANPNLKLEINAYADSRSSDNYNIILSGKRGNWVMKYLIKNGVPETQFIVNAYGEGQLAVECEDCTEEENAKNRRAELRLY